MKKLLVPILIVVLLLCSCGTPAEVDPFLEADPTVDEENIRTVLFGTVMMTMGDEVMFDFHANTQVDFGLVATEIKIEDYKLDNVQNILTVRVSDKTAIYAYEGGKYVKRDKVEDDVYARFIYVQSQEELYAVVMYPETPLK